MSEYKPTFFIIPYRIFELPKVTFAFLKIYETIFQFWNHGCECYLTNEMIQQRTGISSPSTLSDAFVFFEKHGELKRTLKKGTRYLIQPQQKIKDKTSVDKGLATARGGSRSSESKGLATARHNKKNSNTKNINKSSYKKNKKENAKRHEFADSMDQVANEKKHIEENEKVKYAPMPENVRQLCKDLLK